MAKNRFINTKFWSDSFVSSLNPLDRYLFLYLLTNEHTNICGIYELPLKIMANETGIEKDMLEIMFQRLSGKVWHIDGWVFIKNFEKHQLKNKSVEIGIENAKKLIPPKIWLKIKELDRLSTDCPQTVPDCDLLEHEHKLEHESFLQSGNPIASNPEKKEGKEPLCKKIGFSGEQWQTLFKPFEKVNPMFTTLFPMITERNAIANLFIKTCDSFKLDDENGFNKVLDFLATMVKHYGAPYGPKITKPTELLRDLGKLIAFDKQQIKISKQGNLIIPTQNKYQHLEEIINEEIINLEK